MTIYLVWKLVSISHPLGVDEERLVTVCDNIEKARRYRDSLIGNHYITREETNRTLSHETIE